VILQGRRLDSYSHWAPTIDVIDGYPQFDFLSPARNRRQHHDRVGAVRLAFPKSSEANLLGQFNQARHIGSRIVRRRIDLNVVDHVLVPSNYFSLDFRFLKSQFQETTSAIY